MGYNVRWKINKRVISAKLSGVTTVEDIQQGNEAVRQHVSEGENPIHTIIDIRDLKKFPLDIGLFKADYALHDADGWLIIIGGSPKTKFVTDVVAHLVGQRIKRCQTYQDAYNFLAQDDPTLNFED